MLGMYCCSSLRGTAVLLLECTLLYVVYNPIGLAHVRASFSFSRAVLRGWSVAGPSAEHPQEELLAGDAGGGGRDGGGLQRGEIVACMSCRIHT